MNRKYILWITQTALLIAMVVATQAAFGSSQFVTGSIVNFILVAATILAGVSSGVVVGIISPVMSFIIIGRPVFPVLLPFIALGNFVLVVAVYLISVKSYENLDIIAYARMGAAAVAGSVLKFLVLFIGIVRIAVPFLIPGILPPQTAMLSHTFSWPQLVTALIGSIIAMVVMPRLAQALRFNGGGKTHIIAK